MKISHNFQASETCVFIVQEITRQRPVQRHGNGKPQTTVQVPQYTKIHPTHHNHLLVPAHSHKPVVHTANLLYMYKHQHLTLTLPHFHLTCTKLPPPQQMRTPPTQPLNIQFPHSFNPHVPPPYFPQYPPTNSPSAHSTDSSILLALQKQWERQERLDLERNKMEKQKEERKRMKEEREQRKDP